MARYSLTMLLLAAVTAGCAGDHEHEHVEHGPDPWAGVSRAVAVLTPTEGQTVTGIVRFSDEPGGLHVEAEVSGLRPNQLHGFHIHEFGDATCPVGAMCTGGHYDPAGTGYHGIPGVTEQPHHAGDLGNLEADANGRAVYHALIPNLSVAGPLHPVLGRAIIVHAEPDDGGQPVGNAGARIALGIIGIASPPN